MSKYLGHIMQSPTLNGLKYTWKESTFVIIFGISKNIIPILLYALHYIDLHSPHFAWALPMKLVRG